MSTNQENLIKLLKYKNLLSYYGSKFVIYLGLPLILIFLAMTMIVMSFSSIGWGMVEQNVTSQVHLPVQPIISISANIISILPIIALFIWVLYFVFRTSIYKDRLSFYGRRFVQICGFPFLIIYAISNSLISMISVVGAANSELSGYFIDKPSWLLPFAVISLNTIVILPLIAIIIFVIYAVFKLIERHLKIMIDEEHNVKYIETE